MNGNDHEKMYDIFLKVCDLAESDRGRVLDSECGNNRALRQAVEALLKQDQVQHDRLDDGQIESGAHLSSIPFHETEKIPASIGPFQIIKQISEGGMSVVFEAYQRIPRRRIAVKLIRTGIASKSMIERFRREAELLGKLQHPGIAQIIESGTHDTRPYIAMEYVDGQSLTNHSKSQSLSIRARLELVARVADAVHYAHQNGIIHRDLKPDNILVSNEIDSAQGTTPLKEEFQRIGQPKVLDFGIARVIDGFDGLPAEHTLQGQLLGTLAYMSPKQILSNPSIDIRTDVYALGVITFQLLTNELPAHKSATTLADVLIRTTQERPEMIGAHSRAFRGDIETIISKAIDPDRNERYQSMAEFASDIRRHLNSLPIEARPLSLVYQFNRFTKRNKAFVIASIVALLAIVLGFAFTGVYAAQNSKLLSHQQSMLYYAMTDSASRMLAESNVDDARTNLNNAPVALRDWEWEHLNARTSMTIRNG